MTQPTAFEALTGAIGQALALYGGARQTRLTEQAPLGADMFHVEHLEDWPILGRVSVGGITYTYRRRTEDTLLGIEAVIGGTAVPGVAALHPPLSGVMDLSQTYSELDALRGSLFLPTAAGEDLATLGRGFGVPRDESLSGDEQYRSVIRAIAYAPATSISALTNALDALMGPGNYSIDEDPIASPGKVFITVSYAARASISPVGRFYLPGLLVQAPQSDGSIRIPASLRAPMPLRLAPYSAAQDCTAALPSAGGGWTYQNGTETADCQMVPEGAQGQTASISRLGGRYVSTAPTYLPGGTSRLGLLVSVLNPAGLAVQPGGCGGSVCDGERWAAWSLVGPSPQICLIDTSGNVLAGPTTLPSGFQHISLTLDNAGATLRLAGRLVLRCARSRLSSQTARGAAFGNLLGVAHPGTGSNAPQMRLRWVGALAKTPRDFACSQGSNASVSGPAAVTLPGLPMPASAVGRSLWLSGATQRNALGGTASGHYRIASVSGSNSAVLVGDTRTNGALARDAAGKSYLSADASTPFVYPDDLGKTVVVTSPAGSGVAGSYTIQGLYDPSSGADLASFATPLRQRSLRARLGGGTVLATDGVTYRVDPAFVSDACAFLFDLLPASQADGDAVRLTPAQALPLPQASYTVSETAILGGQLEPTADTQTLQTDPGPPPVYDRYPFYLESPFEALESYLPSLTAAGVAAVLRYR